MKNFNTMQIFDVMWAVRKEDAFFFSSVMSCKKEGRKIDVFGNALNIVLNKFMEFDVLQIMKFFVHTMITTFN